MATPPGMGAIDALVPTCGPGEDITVWTLRGHTLSRLQRPRAPGGIFAQSEIVATGADRLGPIAMDHALGPAAWRSPTVALDDLDGDEWWAGYIDPRADAGARMRRGSVTMPAGSVGLGVLAPLGRTSDGRGVEVLGTLARQGENPRLVRVTVPAPSDEAHALREMPPALSEGELKAWEPSNRVALAYVVESDGAPRLRALVLSADSAQVRGEVSLTRQHVLVVARGVARGEIAVFALAEFDVSRREVGDCIALDESLCVTPGPVRLLRVERAGVTTLQVAPRGLVDTIGLDAEDRVLVLYVAAGTEERAQRAARVDVATGRVEALSLTPSDDLPPLDRPALVRCGREPWLAAEVLVSESTDAAARRESAVIALPFACLATNESDDPG